MSCRALIAAACTLTAGFLPAQEPAPAEAEAPLFEASVHNARPPVPSESLEEIPAGTTVITAEDEATFESESREATFHGKVVVIDPEYRLTCDKLTAYLNNGDTEAPAGAGATGSLTRAVAEGNVVVTQIREREGGEKVTYVGKAGKGVYDTRTGDFELSEWPEVQQGINNHVATEAGTVMTITREGRMKTSGGSRTMIQETTPDAP